MATQAIEMSETEEAAPPAKGSRGVLILAIVGVVAGIAVGLFGIGPILAKHKSPSAPVEVKPVDVAATAVNHPIENLVLNPAGSGGTRFLMVTATFQLKDAAAEAVMKDHEAEVRDIILALLGKKT